MSATREDRPTRDHTSMDRRDFLRGVTAAAVVWSAVQVFLTRPESPTTPHWPVTQSPKPDLSGPLSPASVVSGHKSNR